MAKKRKKSKKFKVCKTCPSPKVCNMMQGCMQEAADKMNKGAPKGGRKPGNRTGKPGY